MPSSLDHDGRFHAGSRSRGRHEGDQVGEASAAPLGPVDHGGDYGPGLGDEGKAILSGSKMGEARIEPDPGHQDPKAVRADDAQ
jgi:hypothetical protein